MYTTRGVTFEGNNVRHIHYVRPMDADELRGVQSCLEPRKRQVHERLCTSGARDHVVSVRFEPEHRVRRDRHERVARPDEQARNRPVSQRVGERFERWRGHWLANRSTDAIERREQTSGTERLQQIVDRSQFERRHGVFSLGRREDHVRLMSQSPKDVDPGTAGHLDVE